MLPARLRKAYCDHLPLPDGAEPHLAGALRETLRRPGNLVRAELAFQVARVYGMEDAGAEQLSVALEYFHTASLLFDDLPSMDDATHRRGAVCIHHLFGEGTAILSALALINRAYALAWAAMGDRPAANRQAAAQYLERYLGLNGILDGQSRDIHYRRSEAAAGGAQGVALEKTASLIRLPLVLPAILGGAPESHILLLHRLSMLWGLGYQALDDLKDVLREGHEVGKTTGRDELLARPNVALEQGTEATVVRLHRLAGFANRVVVRLVSLEPRLHFLGRIATRFDTELRATTEASAALQSAALQSAALQSPQGAACCS